MKTLCGWWPESGRLFPDLLLLWPHPGLICETFSGVHGPDKLAASGQHWEKSDMLKRVFSGHKEIKI